MDFIRNRDVISISMDHWVVACSRYEKLFYSTLATKLFSIFFQQHLSYLTVGANIIIHPQIYLYLFLEKQHGDSRQQSVVKDYVCKSLPILVFVMMEKLVIKMTWSKSFKRSIDAQDDDYIFCSMLFYLELAKYLQSKGCFHKSSWSKAQQSIIGSNIPYEDICLEMIV